MICAVVGFSKTKNEHRRKRGSLGETGLWRRPLFTTDRWIGGYKVIRSLKVGAVPAMLSSSRTTPEYVLTEG